jgi:hypothetical protein
LALPTETTPVAKSLHTLTVLQQVAELIHDLEGVTDPAEALDKAMIALGLARRPDPYGLRDRALFLMTREARPKP